MRKKHLYLGCLMLCSVITSLQAATVVWVSDNKTPVGNVPADQQWIDMLAAQGYTVNLDFSNQEARSLDDTKIAALNAADLIIISRDSDSGSYDDGSEPTQWNEITTPIIMQTSLIARSSRWKWLNSGTTYTASPNPRLLAVLPGHPVFEGIQLDASKEAEILTAGTSFIQTTDPGNGTLIAVQAGNGEVWIVEWQAGQEFYPGSGQVAAGKRMLLTGGGTSNVTDGAYNYTDAGGQLFLNAVRYMLGIKDTTATAPEPADLAEDVVRDGIVLSWSPSQYAAAHNVYFGESREEVEAADVASPLLVADMQDANSLALGRLDFNQTYYWRVDEVNSAPDYTVHEGATWSFTVEPVAIYVSDVAVTANSTEEGLDPNVIVNGSGLDPENGTHGTVPETMWLSAVGFDGPAILTFDLGRVQKLHEARIWNSNQSMEDVAGLGVKEAVLTYSVDGETWLPVGDQEGLIELAPSPGTNACVAQTLALDSVVTRYVKMTVVSNWSEYFQHVGLSEVQFYAIPMTARTPVPQPGTLNVDPRSDVLSWRAGRDVSQHEVYLSSDPNTLENGIVCSTHELPLDTQGLALETTYYWQVDEVNESLSPSTWVGELWNFTTLPYFTVDNFESYTNTSPSIVYQTWIDGIGYTDPEPGQPGNNSGSYLGHDIWTAGSLYTSIMETGSTIPGSSQCMPVYYDNSAADGKLPYSQVDYVIGNEDWTLYGLQTLSIAFRGAAGNTGSLFVKINNQSIPFNSDVVDIKLAVWQGVNIDLASAGVDLHHVTKLSIGVEGTGAAGLIYIDDIRLYARQAEPTVPVNPGTQGMLAKYVLDGNANDSSTHHLNGVLSPGLTTWSSPGANGQGSAIELSAGGYVDLGNPGSLDFATGNWTISAWYKTTMSGEIVDENKGTILAKGGDGGGGHRYALIMNEARTGVVSLICDDNVTKIETHSRSRTNDGQWHFVLGQRDGLEIRIYIDGQLEGVSQVKADYDLSGTVQHNAYLGVITSHSSTSLYKMFIGQIDEATIFDRALSEEEILWLAGRTSPVQRPF